MQTTACRPFRGIADLSRGASLHANAEVTEINLAGTQDHRQIVFGIMSAHRTHDITIPRPDETVRFDKPNACNQCHYDWSANRAISGVSGSSTLTARRLQWPDATRYRWRARTYGSQYSEAAVRR